MKVEGWGKATKDIKYGAFKFNFRSTLNKDLQKMDGPDLSAVSSCSPFSSRDSK